MLLLLLLYAVVALAMLKAMEFFLFQNKTRNKGVVCKLTRDDSLNFIFYFFTGLFAFKIHKNNINNIIILFGVIDLFSACQKKFLSDIFTLLWIGKFTSNFKNTKLCKF